MPLYCSNMDTFSYFVFEYLDMHDVISSVASNSWKIKIRFAHIHLYHDKTLNNVVDYIHFLLINLNLVIHNDSVKTES